MTNNTLKLLCDQLEESNDCMLALADTLRKYGHNTTDLLEQIKRNEIIIESYKDYHVVVDLSSIKISEFDLFWVKLGLDKQGIKYK